jgi:DNA-binding IclR family transcriptional regulator
MQTNGGMPSGSQAIERAMSVLNCFSSQEKLTLSEVACRTRIPVSSAHRIMQALVRGGFLRRDRDDAYEVGRRIVDLAPTSSVAEEVAPHLYSLATAIRVVASFGAADGGDLVALVRARPQSRYCSAQIPFRREPLYATAMGKVLLAFDKDGPICAAKRQGDLVPFTSRTRTSREELVSDLRAIRQYGFGLTDGELVEGVRAVAVPVFGPRRDLVGAVGVQARTSRMTEQFVQSLVPVMRRSAAEISRRLGDPRLLAP